MMKMSIGTKLMGLFGFMFMLFVSFSFYVWMDLAQFNDDITFYKDVQQEIVAAKDLQLHVLNVWQFITDASLTKDESVITNEAKPNLDEAKVLVQDLINLNQEEPEHLKLSNDIKMLLDKMWNVGNRMFRAYNEDWDKGNVVMDEYDKVSEETIETISIIIQDMEKEADSSIEELYSMINLSLNVIKGVLVMGMFVGLGIVIYIRSLNKSITKPLGGLAQATGFVAKGDLTVDVVGREVKNEIGDLANNFTSMLEGIRKVLGQIKDGTSQLASASEQLAASSSQISEGSQEQSSMAAQVTTSSQEMSSTIVDVARNAHEVAESAKTASEAASNGGLIVEKTINSINSIAKTSKETSGVIASLGSRSQEVGSIIEVIDDIASQTNLLALNAAIEAARAGEQGRGFSVVANEVKKLAEKTTEATKEISGTIKVIQDETDRALSSMEEEVQEVEAGVALTQEAGAALKEIVSQVDKVSSMIAQIAAASEEQSTASDQISSDVEKVADITNVNAASAQEIASASVNIAEVASNLKRIAAVFKISKNEVGDSFDINSDIASVIEEDQATL